MKDSLARSKSAFEGLRLPQVLVLWNLLCETDIKTVSHIEKWYKKTAPQFSQTLSFFESIGIIKQKNNIISIEQGILRDNKLDVKLIILEYLASFNSPYYREIRRYLNKYNLINGHLKYRAIEEERSNESAVRNFLMELGIVSYLYNENEYVILPDYLYFLARIRDKSLFCTPLKFKKDLIARDEIGLLAEKAAYEFEKERVGPKLSNCVEHLSLHNIAAGYDILSVAAENIMDKTARYIEVKAVSQDSINFRWTHNEVLVAHLLGKLYYLYLVPIGGGGAILKNKIITIANPYSEIIEQKDKWVVESDVFLCHPKQSEAPDRF